MQKHVPFFSLVSALALTGSLLFPSIGMAQAAKVIAVTLPAPVKIEGNHPDIMPLPIAVKPMPITEEQDDRYTGTSELQRYDLHHESLTQFQYKVLSDGTIGVYFTTGSPRCFGSRVVMEENDDSIGIAVITGTLEKDLQICTLEAKYTHFLLHTKKPIDERVIFPLTEAEVQLNQ